MKPHLSDVLKGRMKGGGIMEKVKIAGCVVDVKAAAELLRIIKEIPADKRPAFLDELKKPEYYTDE